jgi:acyl-CoA synthetase (AMP-forming)/AMP-acid ligase II
VTHAFFVPTMAVHLTAALRRRGTGWPTLRLWVSAASPLLDPISDAILAAVPQAELWNCYGVTEGGTLTYTRHADIRRKPGICVGTPAPAMALRVIDAAGRDVPPGAVGEIVCRSPEAMLGYWRDPEKTAATLRHGWVHSGDLGLFDAEGYLHLVGRLKDVIISGGENVYAAEVESYRLASGRLAEVAIVGVPHPVWGEAVVAVAVPHGGTAWEESERDAYARAGLAPHKRPKRFVLRDTLPKNSMGKVLKDRLRQELAGLFAAGAA